MDGTLFETAPELSRAVNLMLKDLEMAQLKTNEIKRFIGRGAENLIKQSIEVSSKKDSIPVFAHAEKLFAHHYSLISANSLMFDGVEKSISHLKEDRKSVV